MDKKWNLQDIRPAKPRKKRPPLADAELQQAPVERAVSHDDDGTIHIGIQNGNTKKRSNLFIALGVFFAVVGVGFLISFMTGGAEVAVFPRNTEPNVNASFTAFRTPQVGELSYEIMDLEAEGERQVTATGQEQVSEQATGEIVIYNNTGSAERLIKNTRFETPDGLIFKITESVVVPGAIESEGELVPGSIRAAVFADGTGEQYNVGTTRMTIPGFEEGGFTELYENIYGENPEPMTGGFEGPKFIIDETELETAKQQLQTELRNALLDRVPSERPAGFVVYDSAVTVTFETLPAVEYGDNLVTIKENALLQIPIFKEEEFAEYIAAATVPGYENEPVRIEDTQSLTFSYTNSTTSITDISNLDSLEFQLVGRPLIVWTYDEGKLKTDLVGAQKTALPTVLGGYPAIERAEAVVRPFWKRSFPEKLEEIEIVETVENSD